MEVSGLDIYCTDGGERGPTVTRLNADKEALEWFKSHPEDSLSAIRVLAIKVPRHQAQPGIDLPDDSFFAVASEHAFKNPEVYYDLLKHSRTGSCTALFDEPWRFMLQTPTDGAPWCSLAASKRGTIVKTVYVYDDDVLNPASIMIGEVIQSGWRGSGLQIINLPQAILRAHSKWCSQRLARVDVVVTQVEDRLESKRSSALAEMHRILHHQTRELTGLERRSRFEKSIVTSIEEVAAKARHGTVPWPPLAPAKSALEARTFDFESLPKRIESARSATNDIILQRTQQQNLEIAELSRRIAEATLSDAASMKTIAVLTMVFLPGTAIASIFSMSMFDWSANDGTTLASKWLWVYFVVAMPATAITLLAWWSWSRRKERKLKGQLSFRDESASSSGPFTDLEASVGTETACDEPIEMLNIRSMKASNS